MPSSRIIGLTGGIASGKSTVAKYLEQQHHCTILDADLYARDAVAPSSPLLQLIQDRYGAKILDPKRELNRQQLGQIIFNDEHERQWLEQLIHPYVRQQLEQQRTHYLNQQAFSTASTVLVMVIPLLFESHMDNLVTEIWVVSCSTSQQQQRLMDRNNLSFQQANARIQSQWPLEDKIARASVVLHNRCDRAQLYRQIDAAIRQVPDSHPSFKSRN